MLNGVEAWVATRKGLFPIRFEDGRPSHRPARVRRRARDQCRARSRATVRSMPRVDHGHFGVHLHRSDDGGASWVEIAAPEYPPKPDDVVHLNPMSQKEVVWATQLGWTIEPGHPDEPGVLWCGTIPGGLFRSDDRGDSWNLVEALWNVPARDKWFGGGYDDAGIHSICIDPRGPGRLVVGLSCGGAWRTDDGGVTWEVAAHGMRAGFLPPELAGDPDTQDPHRLSRCAADPDVLWCQHHCGIFRTTDNGGRWVEIERAGPSTFGFAVAAHPHDPRIGVVRPGDQRRGAGAGRRPHGGHADRATAASRSTCSTRACRSTTPTTSSTGTGSTSTTAANVCCSDRRPARSGTATTPATRSSRSRRTCRRSTPSGSPDARWC